MEVWRGESACIREPCLEVRKRFSTVRCTVELGQRVRGIRWQRGLSCDALCDVVHEDGATCPSEVVSRQRLEPLASCCVPLSPMRQRGSCADRRCGGTRRTIWILSNADELLLAPLPLGLELDGSRKSVEENSTPVGWIGSKSSALTLRVGRAADAPIVCCEGSRTASIRRDLVSVVQA